MRRGLLIIAILVGFVWGSKAQTIADTSMNIHLTSFHLSGQLPAGDMGKRYGTSLGVGGSYMYKTAKDWILMADVTFITGNTYKADSIFDNLKDEYGDFISIYGEVSEYKYYERGFYAAGGVGRLIPIFGPNPNSGLMVTVTGGILQYKTLIHQDGSDIPGITGDYAVGYDRLSNGFALSEFVGYMHLDSNDPVNFYVGLEFTQAWTKNRRDWDYYLNGPELGLRHDYMFGLRFGWIFPINKKATNTYYFY